MKNMAVVLLVFLVLFLGLLGYLLVRSFQEAKNYNTASLPPLEDFSEELPPERLPQEASLFQMDEQAPDVFEVKEVDQDSPTPFAGVSFLELPELAEEGGALGAEKTSTPPRSPGIAPENFMEAPEATSSEEGKPVEEATGPSAGDDVHEALGSLSKPLDAPGSGATAVSLEDLEGLGQ